MAKAKKNASAAPPETVAVIADEIDAAAKAEIEAAANALAEMDAAAAALDALPPDPPAPQPVAVFRYQPNAVIRGRYVDGAWVELQFDADGILKCYDGAIRDAVLRATVDPDIPPHHISQVTISD